jgi:hypothetical protein
MKGSVNARTGMNGEKIRSIVNVPDYVRGARDKKKIKIGLIKILGEPINAKPHYNELDEISMLHKRASHIKEK